ncbi:glycosyltransferase family 4 protein [Vibrio sp. S4M6]|uniref:glycosyltransferase family 4 protein n=1 Tax=Vibrio sinus TaxID=2946865 RepID=UPI00202A0CA4|nr:glycosyltransferase family 4 protein [Vibrio sinus]MCL9781534.1 glycosyltransferase family 4 protein [Vibrio sinus]
MRILVVTQYFWPENFRINDLCNALVEKGHELTVLTGRPNYPSGELFPEYRAEPGKFDEFKGAQVVRIPFLLRGKNNPVRLVGNYISFVLSASTLGLWKLRKQTFDVVFVFEPSPVTVCLPALVYKWIYKTPVVFWVLDLWPETLQALGVVRSPRLLRAIGSMVSFIYRRCDLVLAQSKAFVGSILKYSRQPEKVKYFPSWPDHILTDDTQELPAQLTTSKAFKVLFAGNVGEAQDFPAIVQAAIQVRDKGLNIQIFIVGDGRALHQIRRLVEQHELENTLILLGRYPLEAMPHFFREADALLVSLKESDAFSKTIPGKIQSYMQAEKPILTMLSGEGSRVVDEAQCGLTADSGDYARLADNIESMSVMAPFQIKLMSDNAKLYAEREFSREGLILQLENWFLELTGRENAGKKCR